MLSLVRDAKWGGGTSQRRKLEANKLKVNDLETEEELRRARLNLAWPAARRSFPLRAFDSRALDYTREDLLASCVAFPPLPLDKGRGVR